MAKLFAVIVATVPHYYEYKQQHPEHDRHQLEWFKEQYEKGVLLCCGPFVPHDGTGIWIMQGDTLTEAIEIVNTSPRVRDGMLAKDTRVVEWSVHLGSDRFTPNY